MRLSGVRVPQIGILFLPSRAGDTLCGWVNDGVDIGCYGILGFGVRPCGCHHPKTCTMDLSIPVVEIALLSALRTLLC
ncbi:hypothetical protein BD410DRAFT_365106 [Rickenella mellea]|uniref:Uncharacterized protein n=1 Tax=Rickenella mellea TaxID=50990 RepID=A0A4Y7PG13_9AGAM|nr:hypothetical protein BD410DRAFT_365106 [Rickenella mellea]